MHKNQKRNMFKTNLKKLLRFLLKKTEKASVTRKNDRKKIFYLQGFSFVKNK
jgi:hypothetical protein